MPEHRTWGIWNSKSTGIEARFENMNFGVLQKEEILQSESSKFPPRGYSI